MSDYENMLNQYVLDNRSINVRIPKEYIVDMNKVIAIKDANKKLNALFKIIALLQIRIQDSVVTDELLPFLTEI